MTEPWRWFSDVPEEASGKSSDIFSCLRENTSKDPKAGQSVSGWSQCSGGIAVVQSCTSSSYSGAWLLIVAQ